MIKALKYSTVFFIPFLAIIGFRYGGIWTYAVFIYSFILVPVLELAFVPSEKNLNVATNEIIAEDRMFDYMLYLVLPLHYGVIFLFFYSLKNFEYSFAETIGLIVSVGLSCGVMGINVAHELGHRSKWYEKLFAKLLLLSSFYMHFFIEHNRGHHKNVSTLEDPASARLSENLYSFWLRSIVNSYFSAWKIEAKSLKLKKIPVVSLKNEMMIYQIIQLAYLVILTYFFGIYITMAYLFAAVIGILLLETVNYIEHYGLQRNKVNEFRYENVTEIHSWNSNHILGRLTLFELSRHSDHHFHPGKKYQYLNHYENSPQMPTGYPGMMLLSLVPPLWFKIMNKRILDFKEKNRVLIS
jgi:alkane 1-monooxygenase